MFWDKVAGLYDLFVNIVQRTNCYGFFCRNAQRSEEKLCTFYQHKV